MLKAGDYCTGERCLYDELSKDYESLQYDLARLIMAIEDDGWPEQIRELAAQARANGRDGWVEEAIERFA